MSNSKATGYWTFFCNPKYWAIDDFLLAIKPGFIGDYRITSWQKKYFEKGQLGVIRVGSDTRTKSMLNGKKKLERGIYAIVEIIDLPIPSISSETQFKIEQRKGEANRFTVPIKYIRNYINNPVLLSDIEDDILIRTDSYLLKGIQAASMPLHEDTFNRILHYGEESPRT